MKHKVPVEVFSNSNYQPLLEMTSLTFCIIPGFWAYRGVKSTNYISRFSGQRGPSWSPSVQEACVPAGRRERKKGIILRWQLLQVWSSQRAHEVFAQGFWVTSQEIPMLAAVGSSERLLVQCHSTDILPFQTSNIKPPFCSKYWGWLLLSWPKPHLYIKQMPKKQFK